MSHIYYTPENKKGQHIKYDERRQIEILLKAGHKTKEIARLLGGRSERTIRREIARGTVELLNSDLTTRKEYSADAGQRVYEEHRKNSRNPLKLVKAIDFIEYAEREILKNKWFLIQSVDLRLKTICLKKRYAQERCITT